MPVYKCSNGKYRIGSGPCVYTSKAKADRAWAAAKASNKMDILEGMRNGTPRENPSNRDPAPPSSLVR